jgi:hypothetical protein
LGLLYTFKCNKCNYSVATSGKNSSGRKYAISPYICRDCKIITDVVVGIYGDEIPKEIFENSKLYAPSYIKENKNEFYKCEECENKNIDFWDSSSAECPKCDGAMVIDKDAPIIAFD